jgi:hypothetical protein
MPSRKVNGTSVLARVVVPIRKLLRASVEAACSPLPPRAADPCERPLTPRGEGGTATLSHCGHMTPYRGVLTRPAPPDGEAVLRRLMRQSRKVLADALTRARTRSGEVTWLEAREPAPIRPSARRSVGAGARGAEQGVQRLPSRQSHASAKPRSVSGRGLTAVFGGCVLSCLVPDVAKAPLGHAYAAVERVSIEVAPPPPVPAVNVELFASLALRPTSDDEPQRKDTISDEMLRFGSREISRQLVGTILRAALATEVDPVYLFALADKESSFVPGIRAATSSAEGLFQFIDSTWLDTVKTFGARHGLEAEAAALQQAEERAGALDAPTRTRILDLRRDPYVAAVMAAEMLKRDRADIAFKVGRDLTRTELYLAHFLGPQEAARFIALRQRAQRQSASRAFPAAARANRGIFFARHGRRQRGLAVADVYGLLTQQIDARAARFEHVMAFAADARM